MLLLKRWRGQAIELRGDRYGHFDVPVEVRLPGFTTTAGFLLDTGSTKCAVPGWWAAIHGLEAVAVDMDVGTGIGIAALPVAKVRGLRIVGTKIAVGETEVWLGRDFLLGMNFLSHLKFRVALRQVLQRLLS